MNRDLIQCVVESLHVSGPLEGPLSSLGNFSERDWQKCLPWLDESGLGLHFLKQVSSAASPKVIPAAIRSRLEQDLAANRRLVSLMKKEFGSILRSFRAAGVDYVVLKGFALIPEYCSDAALRSQYDYDFLVRPESASAARQALQALGYSRKDQNPGFQKEDELLFTTQALSPPSWRENFYSPNIARAVELHLSLWESNLDMIDIGTPHDVLDRKRLLSWEGLCFPTLAEDDFLIFQALHAFQHILNFWCRPSCFLEIAHFLARRQCDTAFWEQFRLRADSHKHVPQMLGLVFSMAEKLFQAPVPPEVAEWTTRTLPAPLSFWVQRYGREWALARFPGSKVSLFVHQVFVEDPETWKVVERNRLLPFHQSATVVESGDQSFASRWRKCWEQGRFILGRLRFHLRGFLSYTWERPGWKKNLQRIDRSGYRLLANRGATPARLSE